MYANSFDTPQEAWDWIQATIELQGKEFVTVDGVMTKELENVVVSIRKPGVGWPLRGCEWSNMIPLLEYARQLQSPDVAGFEYTYGNRLTAYFGVNQIEEAIELLQKFRAVRFATMVLWDPVRDLADEQVPVATIEHPLREKPCMTLIHLLVRENKLNVTVVFRAQDMLRAWPTNVFGIYKLQEYIAGEVDADVGTLTMIAISAHRYFK